jgi:RNA polymerase sigma-70 factor (ECF subfamily)
LGLSNCAQHLTAVASPQRAEFLAPLAERDRRAVVLRHVLGYTEPEIARHERVPRGTVSSRLRRAYRTLRVVDEAAGHSVEPEPPLEVTQ